MTIGVQLDDSSQSQTRGRKLGGEAPSHPGRLMFDELTLSQLLGISKPLAWQVVFSSELAIPLPAALLQRRAPQLTPGTKKRQNIYLRILC